MDSKELLERIKRTRKATEDGLKESQRILDKRPKVEAEVISTKTVVKKTTRKNTTKTK